MLENLKIKITDDYVIYLDEIEVGLVNPASLWCANRKKMLAQGPIGLKSIDCTTGFNAIRDLVSIGTVILGTSAEILEAKKAINDSVVSRTSVYLLSSSPDLRFFCNALRSVRNSHVAIVGCGGIGSSSAYLLAGAGVKEFTLIDSDVIERSNFNRQPFWTHKTIGQKKTKILCKELLNRFKSIKINTYEVDGHDMLLKVDSPLSNIDLAVVTVDTPIYVNFKVCKYLKELKIPFVGGGYNHALMTVYDDVNSYQQQDLQWKSYSKNLISPSFGPTNFEIAGLISNKALQCLWGVKKGFDFGIVQTADSRILPRSYKIE